MNSDSEQQKTTIKNIAIFASGAGTNAENCIHYFEKDPNIKVQLIVSNKRDAGVISIALKNNIPFKIYEKKDWEHVENIIRDLHLFQIDLILLAGYLALIPKELIQVFPHKIINIHPALLPKYGGKGMYGKNIHKTVLENGEKETGITIHEVDEIYDNGKIIFQHAVEISPDDTIRSIEQKVRKLEYYYLPRVVEKLLLSKK